MNTGNIEAEPTPSMKTRRTWAWLKRFGEKVDGLPGRLSIIKWSLMP